MRSSPGSTAHRPVADEQVSGFDDVAIADAVLILERNATVCQAVGGDNALVTSMVPVEADQSGEQYDAKLIERGVVGLLAALRIDVAEEDAGIAEHVATGADVDGAVVRNGAGLPVPGGCDGLIDDGVELTSETCGAGIGGHVAEELVELSFAQALELAAIIGSGSLWGENEVGLTADHLRIIVSEIKSEEGRSAGSDPRVFEVCVLEVDKIVIDGNERPPGPHFVLRSERVLLLLERRVVPREAQKEHIERLPLGLVVAHEGYGVGKGKRLETGAGESEIAARKWPAAFGRPASAMNVISPVEVRSESEGLTCCFGRHELGLYAIELYVPSGIVRVLIQEGAETVPLLAALVQTEDSDKFKFDIVDSEDEHLLRSELVVAVGERKLNWLFQGRRLVGSVV